MVMILLPALTGSINLTSVSLPVYYFQAMNAPLKRQFKKPLSDFGRCFKLAYRKSHKKNIHALRVAIKRIHALLRFSEFIAPETVSVKKSYRKLKKLFAKAGKLRTLQMYAVLLKEFKEDKEPEKLKLKMHEQRVQLKKEMRQFNTKKWMKKTGEILEQALASVKSNELCKKIFVFAAGKINHAIGLAKENEFHAARKELKYAHYVLETIQQEEKASALLRTIDPIEKETGRLQDLATVTQLLDKASQKQKLRSLKYSFRKEMKTLETQIQRDFKQLKPKK